MYNQYPYNLFNSSYINNYNAQQMEAQRKYWEQQGKIRDLVKALHDFLDAAKDITPEYQQQAFDACCAEIAIQAAIEQQKNRGQWR